MAKKKLPATNGSAPAPPATRSPPSLDLKTPIDNDDDLLHRIRMAVAVHNNSCCDGNNHLTPRKVLCESVRAVFNLRTSRKPPKSPALKSLYFAVNAPPNKGEKAHATIVEVSEKILAFDREQRRMERARGAVHP